MKTYTIREAQKLLSKVLREVEPGDDIYIARAGKTLVKLVPVNAKIRGMGSLKGKIWWAPRCF